jgi:hypothetical protein
VIDPAARFGDSRAYAARGEGMVKKASKIRAFQSNEVAVMMRHFPSGGTIDGRTAATHDRSNHNE